MHQEMSPLCQICMQTNQWLSQKSLIYLALWFMQRLVHKAEGTILKDACANSNHIITMQCIMSGDPKVCKAALFPPTGHFWSFVHA